ncbi:hypothetical protein CANCADRAFT_42779 [Tortispora caseinolytica NRRL Y-17796]|uniref:Structural maintenance of chromosomes protein n=1 Tax=Tortispora caseinolytica NRRL Y-17796 TaxID=767744 RepID=A0A1E4TK84_9ASCO|nr:hypothetical protein CANCADRAFT_42779 [Tortispora caseinolytica NRRL Y-17796]
MHIKQIIIKGFKSYKGEVIVDNIDPGVNVIVGRNGSGKSNLFAALRFVLSDSYNNISQEEKNSLLHEVSQVDFAPQNAFVEIVFDNVDRKFIGLPDRVSLRRTMGPRKDEYSINGKISTRSEVTGLLESAGFVSSNPYYIVPQGRITSLAHAKPADLIDLIKDASGATLYDKKKEESLNMLRESDAKMKEAQELLSDIKERISELETEKADLIQYRDHSNSKQAAEYILLDRELTELNNALSTLSSQHQHSASQLESYKSLLLAQAAKLQDIEREENEVRTSLRAQQVEKSSVQSDLQSASRSLAESSIYHQERISRRNDILSQIASLEAENRAVLQALDSKKLERQTMTLSVSDLENEEAKFRTQLLEAQSSLDHLLAKSGRNRHFDSLEQRNSWFDQEIASLRQQISLKLEYKSELESEKDTLSRQYEEFDAPLQEKQEKLARLDSEIAELASKRKDLTLRHQEITERRRRLWKDEAKLNSLILDDKEALEQARRHLNMCMSEKQSRALDYLYRLSAKEGIEGYYGVVCDLIQVQPQFRLSAEVSAGNSLFYVVVETEETASKLIKLVGEKANGRATFIPLNRIQVPETSVVQTDDTISLIERIKYDQSIEAAVKFIFGSIAVCPNIEAASRIAKTQGVTAITIQGERSDKSGALYGGYVDRGRSRLDVAQNYRKLVEKVSANERKAHEIANELMRQNQEFTMSSGEIGKLNVRSDQLSDEVSSLREEIRVLNLRKSQVWEYLKELQGKISNVHGDIERLQTSVNKYEQEKETLFNSSLSADEQKSLSYLKEAVPEMRNHHNSLYMQLTEQMDALHSVEAEIEEVLLPKKNGISRDLDNLNVSLAELESSENPVSGPELELAISQLQDKLQRLESSCESLQDEISDIEREKRRAQDAEQGITKSLEELEKTLKGNMAHRGLLISRKNEVSERLRNVGLVPEDRLATYRNTSSDELVQILRKEREILKNMVNVNQNAFDKYTSFMRQQEGLEARCEEITRSRLAIDELLPVLEKKRSHAFSSSYAVISENFSKLFTKLVPNGKATMELLSKKDSHSSAKHDNNSPDDNDFDLDMDDNSDAAEDEEYAGVKISVSFNCSEDEQMLIEQISGGQKTLTALVLIFAIQLSDPAPFYLFDEIDANLDQQYRRRVAALIKEMSRTSHAQFLCTTFRPELLESGDQFYGVALEGKSSSIGYVSQVEAQKFVQQSSSGEMLY